MGQFKIHEVIWMQALQTWYDEKSNTKQRNNSGCTKWYNEDRNAAMCGIAVTWQVGNESAALETRKRQRDRTNRSVSRLWKVLAGGNKEILKRMDLFICECRSRLKTHQERWRTKMDMKANKIIEYESRTLPFGEKAQTFCQNVINNPCHQGESELTKRMRDRT
jgi:hypothetical protein